MPVAPRITACDRADACRTDWRAAFAQVRQHTVGLVAGLGADDQALQSMPDASPTKSHLAHTTWFFETLLLPHAPGYQPVDARWAPLFNAYCAALGPRHPRPRRGLLSRPSRSQLRGYRQRVDAAAVAFITGADSRRALAMNPLLPAFADTPDAANGSYRQPALWLVRPPGPAASPGLAGAGRLAGWPSTAADGSARAGFSQFTLHGERALRGAAPVCHLSACEAEAFATCAGARLPTEPGARWQFSGLRLARNAG